MYNTYFIYIYIYIYPLPFLSSSTQSIFLSFLHPQATYGALDERKWGPWDRGVSGGTTIYNLGGN